MSTRGTRNTSFSPKPSICWGIGKTGGAMSVTMQSAAVMNPAWMLAAIWFPLLHRDGGEVHGLHHAVVEVVEHDLPRSAVRAHGRRGGLDEQEVADVLQGRGDV